MGVLSFLWVSCLFVFSVFSLIHQKKDRQNHSSPKQVPTRLALITQGWSGGTSFL